MQKKIDTNIERLIAKIDNDFNPDNSDWIPRVSVWAIDAMSQLDVLRTERKKKKVPVSDRIAYSSCEINTNDIKVYDKNGCEIPRAGSACGCSSPFTGERTNEVSACNTTGTTDAIYQDAAYAPDVQAVVRQTKDYPARYNVIEVGSNINSSTKCERNYVPLDAYKLELNFDTEYIYIEAEYIQTIVSEAFCCELPVIPNNGLLLEAISYYCIYKMLCRGYKHPVFNLSASQYGTNPYYEWNKLKDEARRSVINDNVDDASNLFRSALYIETFNPKY